jgi:SAM-dependent MidA family methyltransferase
MKQTQSTIFPGMEIAKEIAFEDISIEQIPHKAASYSTTNTHSTSSTPDHTYAQIAQSYIARVGMTFSDYMYHALYNSSFGFYSTGNVIFVHKKDKATPSFITYPVMLSPNFGRMIANQAYGMWRAMLYQKDIMPNEPFSIIEFGAGEGILAKDILHAAACYAQQEVKEQLPTHWQEFYKVLQYTIGEKSPELRQRQKNLNQEAIKAKKLTVKAADARDMQNFTDQTYKGLIVSNELPDAFPVHKIWQMADGRIKVCVVTPAINRTWLKKHVSSDTFERLLAAHEHHEKLVQKLLQDPELAAIYQAQNSMRALENSVFLSAHEWLAIKESFGKKTEEETAFDHEVYFLELYFDADLFPETKNYRSRHAHYIKWLGSQTHAVPKPIWYMNYAAQDYIACAAHILEKGFIITIDYGKTSILHHHEMLDPIDAIRMYPCHNGSSDRDVYTLPGRYDLTTSINFTDICLTGIENGLSTIFYGPQNALNGTNIATAPERTMIPFDLKNQNFAIAPTKKQLRAFEHSIEESFRMIIQQKKGTRAYYKLMHPSEQLFPEIL